ncbi:hypothetical protein AUF62_02065 [archaeon 13_1_20CM_52_20]|nr:MAG: hypothetical protein AUF62_02065 [archaeon 13_1_20CM_52_20]
MILIAKQGKHGLMRLDLLVQIAGSRHRAQWAVSGDRHICPVCGYRSGLASMLVVTTERTIEFTTVTSAAQHGRNRKQV